MSPREELLDQILSAWAELMTIVQQLDGQFDADLGDGWRARDVLAHIALWERVANWKLSGADVPNAAGVADREPWDVNFFNEAMRERWRDRSVDEVLAELRAAHEALVITVSTSSDDDCTTDGRVRSVIQEDGAGHYEMHLPELRAVQQG